MGRRYTAMRPEADGAAFQPTAGVVIWSLEAAAAKVGRITDLWWGGETTVSTAMRSRVSRDSAVGTGGRTAITKGKPDPNDPASDLYISSAYATTNPTQEDGVLFGCAWNAHGGVVRWKAGPTEGFTIVGAGSISCRAVVGTGESTYGVGWTE